MNNNFSDLFDRWTALSVKLYESAETIDKSAADKFLIEMNDMGCLLDRAIQKAQL